MPLNWGSVLFIINPANGPGSSCGAAQPGEGMVKVLTPVCGETGRCWDWLLEGSPGRQGWPASHLRFLPPLRPEMPCKIHSLTSRAKQCKWSAALYRSQLSNVWNSTHCVPTWASADSDPHEVSCGTRRAQSSSEWPWQSWMPMRGIAPTLQKGEWRGWKDMTHLYFSLCWKLSTFRCHEWRAQRERGCRGRRDWDNVGAGKRILV